MSGDVGVVDKVVGKLFGLTKDDQGAQKLKGTMDLSTRLLFHLLVAVPLAGCADLNVESTLEPAHEEAMCKLLQYGQGYEPSLCCIDLTDKGQEETRNTGLGTQAFAGELVLGLNYWSPTPSLHNDTIYNATLRTCEGRQDAVSATAKRVACNREIITAWSAQGVRVGSGTGKKTVLSMVSRVLGGLSGMAGLNMPPGMADMGQLGGTQQLAGFLSQFYTGKSAFRCVAPVFPAAVTAQMEKGGFATGVGQGATGDKCFNFQEGLAIVAKYAPFPLSVHPAAESEPIPECTAAGTCKQNMANVLGKEKYLRPPGGRWAQICDAYTTDTVAILGSAGSEVAALLAVNQIPCTCRWVLFAKQLTAMVLLPNGPIAQISGGLSMPKMFNCPKDTASAAYKCELDSVSHPLSIPEFFFSTPAYATNSFYVERAMEASWKEWWNRDDRILTKDEYNGELQRINSPGFNNKSCVVSQNCWEAWIRRGGMCVCVCMRVWSNTITPANKKIDSFSISLSRSFSHAQSHTHTYTHVLSHTQINAMLVSPWRHCQIHRHV